MLPFSWICALSVLCISIGSADLYRHYRQVSAGNQPGLCRYGKALECCYGWKKNRKGHCEAQCGQGCKYGECVGPNKCKCFPGYTGKACNQDLNECGLKPRPCQHRCMNTHGSYKCYCLNGYALTPEGSCTNSRTCALAHCQYGCEEVQGEIRCICPSAGLQLGPDQRTCIDIDECTTGKNLCPYNRRCVNTFGSYFCKCQAGYDLKYVNGRYDCEVVVLPDINECVTGIHKCSHHADCLNTLGSYKCKCRPGFRGSGFECSAIPNPSVKSPRILGGSRQDKELIKNLILEPAITPSTKTQPYDYEGDVYIGNPVLDKRQEGLSEEKKEDDSQKNQINNEDKSRRGDVFAEFQSVFGPEAGVKKIPLHLDQDEFIMDCNFDQGVCDWVQDREDNFDWIAAYHDNGKEYYTAVSDLLGKRKDLARLNLLLSDRVQKGGFCLTFNYRLVGRHVGALRVLLDNTGYPVWEQSRSQNQDWQTELVTVAWEQEPPKLIIFEAERGKGTGGEIGLDNVVLTSGPCQDDKSVIV